MDVEFVKASQPDRTSTQSPQSFSQRPWGLALRFENDRVYGIDEQYKNRRIE